MALALPLLGGLALAPLLGGRWRRLATLRLRVAWLFYAAIGLQLVAFPVAALPWRTPDRAAVVLWLASYGLLALAAFANFRTPGVPLVGVGMLSNLAAILSNGGHMPALPSALRAAGLQFEQSRNSTVSAAPHLAPLVDRWAAPDWVPWGNVFSVGDVLIAAGGLVFALAATGVLAGAARPGGAEAGGREQGTRLRRLGGDLSIVSWGALVETSEAAAAELAGAGVAVEVLDLGDPRRYDRQAVLTTVAKTSKVLIVGNGGLDAELAALIVEQAFEHLDAPVRRVAAPDRAELAELLRDLAAY